ncbi:hypothetical protein M2375_001682 [Comamonas sp. BIGb0152]|uniref:hypothetical protein n=1 Tax=Comamonas sp. BIGb0152 TaxID=2940601 RepID=UPI0021682452|nr:hypothetical protein [Comamonas sp. BIGb0152]MCS4293465.1 hypothetical protein [Comamonas sp. BIGb0152]
MHAPLHTRHTARLRELLDSAYGHRHAHHGRPFSAAMADAHRIVAAGLQPPSRPSRQA